MAQWITTVAELPCAGHASRKEFCTCCGQKLNGKVRMLELDQRSDTYHDFGGVPESQSQGWFPFGLSCAKKLVKTAKEARNA